MTTTPLKPIETHYAGCRFRSRLEARWAVFFDALGVSWEYEPQGYTIGPDATPYLPDFYLPTMDAWVEVKGVLGADDLRTLIYAASGAGLPLAPGRPLARDSLYPIRHRILILGTLPEPQAGWSHQMLSAVADNLVVLQGFTFAPLLRSDDDHDGTWWPTPVGSMRPVNQFIAGAEPPAGVLARIPSGVDTAFLAPYPQLIAAYSRGRSARFEHGERG